MQFNVLRLLSEDFSTVKKSRKKKSGTENQIMRSACFHSLDASQFFFIDCQKLNYIALNHLPKNLSHTF